MADIGAFFKKDLGGIPVWGWALVVVGGVGIGYFVMKGSSGSNPLSGLFGGSGSTDTSTSAASTLAGQSGNGTVPQTYNNPDTGFASTNVNGQNVPILPPGYQPVLDAAGNVIGYSLTPVTTTTSTGTTSSNGSNATKSAVTKKSGSLETTPHDVNGGKNILTVPSGSSVTFVGGPVPDPKGGSKQYYQVSFNGQTGYIGSDVLPVNPFSSGGGGQERTYQANVFGAY